jgi:endonuclease G, mitochondrial
MKNQFQRRVSFLTLLLLLGSGVVFAAASIPPSSQYLNGEAPVILNMGMINKARELRYDNFIVMHSGISRTPLWSAEHLTKENLLEARKLERQEAFHHEARLPVAERAELADYANSGLDRGNMAPAADMPTMQAQQQSFTLANMIPHDHENNTKLWEQIESAVRDYAIKQGELYIITGPLFIGANLQRLNGRVLVPSHVYKIVFDPRNNIGAAYFVKNVPGKTWQVLSIRQLENMAGINFFPNVPAATKENILKLPEPEVKH